LGQAQKVDVPDAARYSKILKSKNPDTSLREMQSLRSKLLETARQARKDGQWNKARIAEDISEAILRDLDNASESIAPLKDAIAMTRHFKTRFESGEVGKILGYSKSGAPAINPDLTLEVSIGRLGERGAIDMDKIVVTPEAREATSKYLARSFTDYAAERGVVDIKKAERWVRSNEKILDEYPELRTQMMDATESQKLADQTAKRMAARKKRLQDPKQSITARYLSVDNLDNKIDDILKTRHPAKTTKELVKQAQRIKSGVR
jgi:Mg2+ and Co2+ transporter CorA